MTQKYKKWNNFLFKYFFGPQNNGKTILCAIDAPFLDDIGKDLGGSKAFIEDVIGDSNSDQPFHEYLSLYITNPIDEIIMNGIPKAPVYFANFCFLIFIWTYESTLNASNYYGKLTQIIHDHTIKDSKNIDASNNVNIQNSLRDSIKAIIEHLTNYTNNILHGHYGVLEIPIINNEIVERLKSQILIRANDIPQIYSTLNKFSILPTTYISDNDMMNFIHMNRAAMLSTATCSIWENGDTLIKAQICEYIQRIKSNWDGELIVKGQNHVWQVNICNKQAKGLRLIPVLTSKQFNRNRMYISLRLEIDTQEYKYPITIEIEGIPTVLRNSIDGYSEAINLDDDILGSIFGKKGKQDVITYEGLPIPLVFSDSMYFSLSNFFNGFLPDKKIEFSKYIFTCEQGKYGRPTPNDMKILPDIPGFRLIKNDSFEPKQLNQNLEQKYKIEAFDAICKQREPQNFFRACPPLLFFSGFESVTLFKYQHKGKTEALISSKESNQVFIFPNDELESGLYQIYAEKDNVVISDSNAILTIEIVDYSYSLDEASINPMFMDVKGNDFLYPADEYRGKTTDNQLLVPDSDNSILEDSLPVPIEFEFYSECAEFYFDGRLLQHRCEDGNTIVALPVVEKNQVFLELKWYGILMNTYPISILKSLKVQVSKDKIITAASNGADVDYLICNESKIIIRVLNSKAKHTKVFFGKKNLCEKIAQEDCFYYEFSPEGQGELQIEQDDEVLFSQVYKFLKMPTLKVWCNLDYIESKGIKIYNCKEWPDIRIRVPESCLPLENGLKCISGKTQLQRIARVDDVISFKVNPDKFEFNRKYLFQFCYQKKIIPTEKILIIVKSDNMNLEVTNA